MRSLQIALLAALALAASGCGAKEGAATGGADLAPASTPAFVSIDSDLGSDQWQTVDKLLDSFPGKSQLLAYIRSELREEPGVDYERDVKPALGPEVDVLWLDFEGGGSNVVAITKPKDERKFKALIDKANKSDPESKLLVGKAGGWTVLADSQAKLDRFRDEARGRDKLADDDTFQAAMAELPDEALVKAYVTGADVIQLFQRFAAGTQGLFNLRPEQRPEFIAAGLAAEDKGLRLVGVARAEREPKAQAKPFESKLVDDVPADAVAFVTFRGGDAFDQQLGQLKQNPAYRQSLRALQQMFGVPFDKLFSLFRNEVVFYIRPGSPIPELTLLLEAPNEQATLRVINSIISKLSRSLPAQPCHVPAECTDLNGVEISRAAFDGKVVITTQWRAIEEIGSRGPKLPDDANYRDALDAAGTPDETSGLVYVDLKGALPLLLGLAQASDEQVPQAVRANLRPLRSLVIWSSGGDRTQTFTLFLRID